MEQVVQIDSPDSARTAMAAGRSGPRAAQKGAPMKHSATKAWLNVPTLIASAIKRLALVFIVTVMALSGCGGGGGDSATPNVGTDPPPVTDPKPNPDPIPVQPGQTGNPFTIASASLKPKDTPTATAMLAHAAASIEASRATPTLPMEIAMAAASLELGWVPDQTIWSPALVAARTAYKDAASRRPADSFGKVRLGLELIQAELVRKGLPLTSASRIYLVASQALFGQSSAAYGPVVTFSLEGLTRQATAREQLFLRGRADPRAAVAINAIFAGVLPPVEASYDQVCQGSAIACSKLQGTATKVIQMASLPAAEARAQAMAVAAESSNAVINEAKKCLEGDTSCVADSKDTAAQERTRDIERIANVPRQIGKLGEQLGFLSAEDVATLAAGGAAAQEAYRGAVGLVDAFKALRTIDMTAATRWIAFRGYVYGDTKDPKVAPLSALVDVVQSGSSSVNLVISGARALMSLFGGKLGSSSAAKAQQQQAQALLDALRSFEERTMAELALVRSDIRELRKITEDGLTTLLNAQIQLDLKVSLLRSAVADISRRMDANQDSIQGYFSDISVQELNQIKGVENPNISAAEWVNELIEVANFLVSSATNTIHAGPVTPATNAYEAFVVLGGSSAINGLASWPAALGQSKLTSQRLAGPAVSAFVGRTYFLALLEKTPALSSDQTATARRQIQRVLDVNVVPLLAFSQTVQRAWPQLSGAIEAELVAALQELQTGAAQHRADFLKTAGPKGTDVSRLDVFGATNQTVTGYTPRALQQGTMPWCGGAGYDLPIPDGVQAMIPAEVQVAELTSGKSTSVCWTTVGKYAGGWDTAWWQRVKDDRRAYWGTMTIEIRVFFDQQLIGTKKLQPKNNNGEAAICFDWDPEKDIQATVAARRPAHVVAHAAWTSNWPLPAWNVPGTPGFGQVKAQFERSATETYQVRVNAPEAFSAINQLAGAGLKDLGVRANSSMVDQFDDGGALAKAARRLDGARAALRGYLLVGFPNAMKFDDRLISAFQGARPLVDASSVRAMFVGANSSATKVDFLAAATTEVRNLMGATRDYAGRLGRDVVDENSELEDLRAQLTAWRDGFGN